MSIFYKAQQVADLLGVDLGQADALANAGKLATKSVNGDTLVSADSLVDLAGDGNFDILKSALVPFIKKQGLGMGSSFPMSAVAQLLGSNNSGVSSMIQNGLLSAVMQGGEQMVSGNALLGMLNSDQDKYGSVLGKLGNFALQQIGFGKAGKFEIPAVASLLGLGASDVQGLLGSGMLSRKMDNDEAYVEAGSLSRYINGEPKYAELQDSLGGFAFSQLGFDVPEGLLGKLGMGDMGKIGAGLAGAAAAVGAGVVGLKDKIEMPDVDLPNIGKPDVNVPDINVPDVNIPDVNVPDVNVPDVALNTPDVSIPEVNLPDVDMPGVRVPDVDIPSMNMPEIDKSGIELPDFKKPDLRQPDLDVVGGGLPKWLLPVVVLGLLALGAFYALTKCGSGAIEDDAPVATELSDNSGGAAVSDEDGVAICQITDVGGIDDRSFNATAWAGAEQAAEDLGGTAQYIESQDQASYARNIDAFIDEGCDLIVTVGFALGDATGEAAEANPDQKFAIVDFAYDPGYDNVLGLIYNVNEAAFLAGYVAADQTETGTVATFGGEPYPSVTAFMDGFVLGVDYYNEQNDTDVNVLGWDVDAQNGSFTGNFESTDDGRTLGESLMDEGADIIMPVAGPVGLGTAEAARERGTQIIGVDTDWTVSTDYDDVVLTSVLKRMDTTVYGASELVANDEFVGGTFTGTLENDGVGIVTDGLDSDLVDALDDIAEMIIDGDLNASP